MPGARVAALEAVAGRLRCPHCASPVALDDRTVGCRRGHRYDIARQGYVSLFPPAGRPHTGDTAAMVAARETFLGAGHYNPIARAVADAADAADPHAVAHTAGEVETPPVTADGLGTRPAEPGGMVVDLGAGTGYYLAAVLDRRPAWRGLALDASREALRRAVRAHARIAGVRCDAWRPLPVRDGAADLVLNIFAPRAPGEIARVLAPGAAVVIVTPGPGHLHELIEPLGMLAVGDDKQERLRESLSPHLEPAAARDVEVRLSLTREDVRALVAMGPSAHHVDAADLERRLAALPDPVDATASVVVETFRGP